MATHVVKKYSNRKLYDTYTRRYVTLDVIADLLREGHEVQVVDRSTGADITAVTLSQILVDMVKERSEQLLALLRGSLALPRRAAVSLEKSTQAMDEAISSGLRNLNIATTDDIEVLEQRLAALTRRVEDLEARNNSVRAGSRGTRASA